jgi:hypothetical protein
MCLRKFVMQPTIHAPITEVKQLFHIMFLLNLTNIMSDMLTIIKLKHIFLNPPNRSKCNVGCITNFVRFIITRESPYMMRH